MACVWPWGAAGLSGRDAMSEPLKYPVPWDLVFGLTPHIRHSRPRHLGDFTARIVARMRPEPAFSGLEHLPADPRFVLAANHFQRKGLWILHSAAVLTQAVARRYPLPDPPVRWIVTANWPPVRLFGRTVASPGDWLLPRVAAALHCYPVPFSGANALLAAKTLRRLLRDESAIDGPIGLFPEGSAGHADMIGSALPGISRLLMSLNRPVIPARIREEGARLHVRFGAALPPDSDVMAVIRAL